MVRLARDRLMECTTLSHEFGGMDFAVVCSSCDHDDDERYQGNGKDGRR